MPAEAESGQTLALMRKSILDEWEEAEQEFSALRMRVERMESDLRVGLPEHTDYQQVKGHDLPQAEGRVLALFRQLLKIEDKINLGRRAG
jgi:hypothetical protein